MGNQLDLIRIDSLKKYPLLIIILIYFGNFDFFHFIPLSLAILVNSLIGQRFLNRGLRQNMKYFRFIKYSK